MHWTSGIELGIRLISWTWIRRLLNDWPEITDLFEHNELALRQIYWHQSYLAAFQSRGSSANNHVIAEAAGQLVGACAFPWFRKSARWRADAAALLEKELHANTFPSGVNRELATDYHGFVSELGLYAALEADMSGHPLARTPGPCSRGPSTWPRRSSTPRCGRPARVTTTRAWCSFSIRRTSATGRRTCRSAPPSSAARLVAAEPGDRDVGHRRLARRRRPVRPTGRATGALRGRRPDDPPQPRRQAPRSGAAPTPARTASCPSPRTRTATRCPWRSGSTASTSWPTRARTATTVRKSGGTTSARPSPTTPSRSPAPSSPSGVARSSGCAEQPPAYAGTTPTVT